MLALIISLGSGMATALAVGEMGGYELDANAIDETPTTIDDGVVADYDWENIGSSFNWPFFTGPASLTTFVQGASKDIP